MYARHEGGKHLLGSPLPRRSLKPSCWSCSPHGAHSSPSSLLRCGAAHNTQKERRCTAPPLMIARWRDKGGEVSPPSIYAHTCPLTHMVTRSLRSHPPLLTRACPYHQIEHSPARPHPLLRSFLRGLSHISDPAASRPRVTSASPFCSL